MTDWKSRLAFEMPFLEQMLAQQGARAHALVADEETSSLGNLQRRERAKVLDCACGTGWHAIALAQRGYRVAGSDISTAMVARARENAAREGVAIQFAAAGFQDLRATFRERFDAVLCLGNSLPHVLTDDAALDSLANMRDCLRDGGVLILHNLNYDKRWREKPRWFAVNSGESHGRETLIWRFADYGDDSITFNIALFAKSADGAWSVDVQSTPQRPYRKQEIENLLRRAGFRDLAFYGSLKGDVFDTARSGDLVVSAVA